MNPSNNDEVLASHEKTVFNKPDSEASESSVIIDSPPDGGLTAWLQVVASWMIFFNTWGLLNSFGVFQNYYTTTLLPTSSPSTISWIGGIQTFLLMIIGAPCGRLVDAGYLHTQIFIGIFLEVFGMMMASISTKYWQLFLSQGVCVGLGAGFLWYPCPTVIGQFFQKRRMTALGIAATGSSLAGIIYPIIFSNLLSRVGFAWSMRILGLIMLGTLGVCVSVIRLRLQPRRQGPFWDQGALREPAYVAFIGAFSLMMMGSWVPYNYVETFAGVVGVNESLAKWLLPIMNACSLIGRTGPNYVADKVGGLNIMTPSIILAGVVSLLWALAKTSGALIALAILYGFISGSMISLPPAIIAHLTPRADHIGTRVGMAYTIASFFALVGNPIGGAILSLGKRHHTGEKVFFGTWFFAGLVLVTGGLLCFVTRYKRVGLKLTKI
ncbi:hypothetical protein D9619_004307 [Psilocybe cf. subviscida]|uniref:Major facilitator superfamily (MFS) profile domain-containing protein n=1 Tax=Psilocybe cf. subviscida TaxID=2480587 RepID=A0A8H5F8J4_9AGAR|nr:hypothetical protein D9619_004307 [Psilocybe cf. subviscida]